MTLEQLLADWRGDAAVLRRQGEPGKADMLENRADQVKVAAEPYLTWLSEEDAMRRSDRTREWLRTRFAEWEREDNARRRGRAREYRMLVVPQRANVSAAFQAGRKVGKAS